MARLDVKKVNGILAEAVGQCDGQVIGNVLKLHKLQPLSPCNQPLDDAFAGPLYTGFHASTCSLGGFTDAVHCPRIAPGSASVSPRHQAHQNPAMHSHLHGVT